MPRPVCLFTGQWADLSLESLAAKARSFGYDGLELACWGDHFEVDRALAEAGAEPPKVELTAKTVIAGLKIPAKWVTRKLEDGVSPMEIKKRLAENLVQQYHGGAAAGEAAANSPSRLPGGSSRCSAPP